MIIVSTILIYFALLLLVSRFTVCRADNLTFYRGERKSPWYMVAFGMVGASVSGVTFVSVPGMVGHSAMTYLQTCMGFIVGYLVVAFVLLPVYYRLNLTTIYTYLDRRLGKKSYKTGAWFFLLSKTAGAAVRFYVVCLILHNFVLGRLGIPFVVTATLMVALIWLYTRKGGIKTLVWTDTFQTFCMLAALLLIIFRVTDVLGLDWRETINMIAADERSRIFVFDDWASSQNFWKQFVSGAFIVIVMTGLDQDMMQKNLTCKTLKQARMDMCAYGIAFVPVNLLFLSLGVLLSVLAAQTPGMEGLQGDELLPAFAATGYLGAGIQVFFTIGILAASFSSADSALTALTTTFCVDICEKTEDERLRRRTHIAISAIFVLFILFFHLLNSTSLIDAVYIIVGYTYGPLLGLFAFGLLTRRRVSDAMTPAIAVLSPLLCYIIGQSLAHYAGYRFGYELLLLNGMFTFAGLWMFGKPAER